MQTFTAHDSDVKSIAVDESGEFFVTGSLDGDIKVGHLQRVISEENASSFRIASIILSCFAHS